MGPPSCRCTALPLTLCVGLKWFEDVRPLMEGDLVVIVDETVRNGWLRGRVIKTYPGIDGQVREVDFQTESGVLQRPAIKIALLDVLPGVIQNTTLLLLLRSLPTSPQRSQKEQ